MGMRWAAGIRPAHPSLPNCYLVVFIIMGILTSDDQVLLQGTSTPSVHAHVGRTQPTPGDAGKLGGASREAPWRRA